MQLINLSGRKVQVNNSEAPGLIARGFRTPIYRIEKSGSDSRNIVVSRPIGGLGDMVCVEPVIRGLRAAWPGHRIIAIIPRALLPVLPGADTYLYAPSLYQNDYRLFVDLNCPAYQYEASTGWRPSKGRTRAFCDAAMVEPSPPRLEITSKHVDEAYRAMPELDMLPRPLIAVQYHSSSRLKDWPHMVEFAGHVAKFLGGTSILLGNKEVKGGEGCFVPPTLEVGGLMTLVSMCELAITPDSGIFHMASALGVPTVGLFGPTIGSVTAELYPLSVVLQGGCPYGADPCYLCNAMCSAKSRCMKNISPDAVMSAVQEVLYGSRIDGNVGK